MFAAEAMGWPEAFAAVGVTFAVMWFLAQLMKVK